MYRVVDYANLRWQLRGGCIGALEEAHLYPPYGRHKFTVRTYLSDNWLVSAHCKLI